MRTFTCLGASATAITLLMSSALTLAVGMAVGTANASPGVTRVPLDAYQRHCDFSREATVPMTPRTGLATGMAQIHTSGSQAIAQVEIVDAPDPGAHFDVELIQEPRPAGAGCAPGQPGVAFGGLDTNGAGEATMTIQDVIRPGTTGVWVNIDRPNEHSENPAEFYSSEFLAPV